jgi:hypothetical protein
MSASVIEQPEAGELRGSAILAGPPQAERAFTWRSLMIGTLAAVAVCALVPYNDFVLSDTSLAAGYLPLAAVLIEFLLIVGVNAPLHRWAPRYALNSRELAVIVLMLLVGCSLPNWGLMRFFIPAPVAPFYLGATDPQFWRAFLALDLPTWLFPVQDVSTGRTSSAMWWFYLGTPEGESPPYGAWVIPMLAWGVFLVGMLAALVAMARMVLEQWAGNERLPFPLVQVQAALIEPPAPGHALNGLLRNRYLWIGLGTVFALHSFNALHGYQPTFFPEIPLGYDLSAVFADEPFSFLRTKVKAARLSFMVIGVTYFIRTKVAFSLFAIYLLVNLVDVQAGMMRSEMSSAAWADQHLGACAAFVIGMLWIGRHFWWKILRNAVGAGGSSLYRFSFWTFVAGTALMIAWLLVVGVQPWLAAMIVLFILVTHLIVARVVAETGIPFYRTGISVSQVYTAFPAAALTGRDVFFSGVFTILGPLTTRDGVMGLTLHGMGVARSAQVREPRKQGIAIAWVLLIGFVVAGAATLYCQYNYATPVAREEIPQRNWFGAVYVPERDMGDALVDHAGGSFQPPQHNRALHVGIGFGATVMLEIASLRFASWPLLPVGFVTSYGAFIQNVWFSIFVGWLVKVMLVRFGGATMYQSARPLFVGLIFGEALAAGIWLAINAVLVANGYDSHAFQILL